MSNLNQGQAVVGVLLPVAVAIIIVIGTVLFLYQPYEDERDPCRVELEEAWLAYQAGDMAVARDRLENAVGATCLTEVE